jgi:hypothetical protein
MQGGSGHGFSAVFFIGGHSPPYFLRLHSFLLFEKEGVRGEFEVSFRRRTGVSGVRVPLSP